MDDIFGGLTEVDALNKRIDALEQQLTAVSGRNYAGISPSDFIDFTKENLGVIAASNTTANLTGSTTETTLKTLTLPANKVLANGTAIIRVNWRAQNTGGAAGTQTLKIKYGSYVRSFARSSTSGSAQQITVMEFTNNNSTSSQVASEIWYKNDGASSAVAFTHSGGGIGMTTPTENTEQPITIDITGTLTNTSHDIWVDSVSLEVYPKS